MPYLKIKILYVDLIRPPDEEILFIKDMKNGILIADLNQKNVSYIPIHMVSEILFYDSENTVASLT